MVALSGLCLFTQTRLLRLEAEDGLQFSTQVVHERKGFSGTGYVTGLTQESSHIIWKFKGKPGIYTLRLGYCASGGQKGTSLKLNGVGLDVMLAATDTAFHSQELGKVELKPGENTLELDKGWGYYDVDYVDIVPSRAFPKPRKPLSTPTDPKATPEARRLYSSLRDRYGNATLSGQYEKVDCDHIFKASGVHPAIEGLDLIDYSPSRIERRTTPHETEDAIKAVKEGEILTLSWHWNAPTDLIDKVEKDANGHEVDHRWYRGFYTEATTFDFQKALSDPNSPNYKLLLRDIDAIAVQLKRLANKKIPVLWRPLHEAEGGWFWWGAKGPKSYIQLWRLLYYRLTEVHHLHNLIWVYSSGVNPDWYPGNEYVDVVGIDVYPSSQNDVLSDAWSHLRARFDGRKMLAISEFGGIPDIHSMRKLGIDWSYFVSWGGTATSKPDEEIKRLYGASGVLNRNALPVSSLSTEP